MKEQWQCDTCQEKIELEFTRPDDVYRRSEPNPELGRHQSKHIAKGNNSDWGWILTSVSEAHRRADTRR